MPTARILQGMGLLTEETAFDFDQLRRMRNLLVHGVEVPPIADLDEATNRLQTLLDDIEERLQGPGDSE
jgi:uncharacterized protein YutE (UPF0331/DUF86 family)